jgi:hypothetical protein
MVKRKIHWEFYAISGFFTMILLIGGVYFGIFLSKEKIVELERGLEDLKRREEDIALEFALLTTFENSSCEILSYELNKAVTDADKLGSRLVHYETTERVKASGFYPLKKDYTLTLIRAWLYLERMKSECNMTGFVTNLYFYSNKNCPDCPRQGLILDYIKRTYPQNIMTFALDYDIDLNVINLLKSLYKVEKVPTLVIDGKKYEGLVTLQELKEILCSEINICES